MSNDLAGTPKISDLVKITRPGTTTPYAPQREFPVTLQQLKDVVGGGAAGDTLPSQTGNGGKYLTTDGASTSWGSPAGSGDVVGPGSATDNAVARFDATTGKLLQNSVVTVGDAGAVDGVTTLHATGAITGDTTIVDRSGIIGKRIADLITQASHGFAAGAVLYNANGTWTAARADLFPQAKNYSVGVVESAPTVNTFVIVYAGPITLAGLTASSIYYLSDATAGLLTLTAPTTVTSCKQVILRTGTSTLAYVNLSDPLPLAKVDLTADVANALPFANGGTNSITSYGAFDGLSVHGADIASATTLNLSAATGNLVDVTGTTAITGITLTEGTERTVRFTGALTLTHGASLVLPGGVSITTVAGDIAIFRGYAAGVVRCVLYSPITVTGTGSAVKSVSPVFTGTPSWPAGGTGAGNAAALGSYGTPDTTAGAITWTAPLYEVFTNTTTTYALPAAAGYAGRGVIFYVVGTNLITIDPNASEVIVRDGTAQTGGVTMTLAGVAGNYVAMMCDGTRWVTLGFKGTLAAGS